jgi:uncharacterized membrane protein YkvA (DUF1232 family)
MGIFTDVGVGPPPAPKRHPETAPGRRIEPARRAPPLEMTGPHPDLTPRTRPMPVREARMTASNQRRVHLDPEILGPEETREERIRERLWSTVKRAARTIPFIDEVVAAWFCALDPATPRRVRLGLLAALAYFVAPIDVVPDILPLVGFGDDAGVLMAAITLVRAHITDDHREAARRAMAEH